MNGGFPVNYEQTEVQITDNLKEGRMLQTQDTDPCCVWGYIAVGQSDYPH